jgi:hypothetical protein
VPTVGGFNNMEDILLTVFAIVMVIILLGCLYSFFSAIFFLVFSWGKADKQKRWRNSLRFMIIGVLIFIGLLISFPYVLRSMDVELTEDYSIKKVFVRAWDLFSQIFEIWWMIKEAQKENEYRGTLFYDLNNSTNTNTKTPSSLESEYEL